MHLSMRQENLDAFARRCRKKQPNADGRVWRTRPHTSHYLLASYLSVSSLSSMDVLFSRCLAISLYSSVDCSLPPHIANRPFSLSTHRFFINDCSLPPRYTVSKNTHLYCSNCNAACGRWFACPSTETLAC